jgi:quinol monooxygenase YgiN
MPLIRTGSGIVTQINTFTVSPQNQDALLAALAESAEFVRDTPGWLSASLHRSLDGTRVVNYAQSRDMASALRVIERLRVAGHLDRNAELGTSQPGLYEVAFTLEN